MARRSDSSPGDRQVIPPTRQALVHRLRIALQPIVLVSGPAGSGKSTLVEEWARDQADLRFLAISRHHNAAASLLSSILEVMGAEERHATPEEVTRWLGQLSRALPATSDADAPPTWLVLDRAELITDPDAHLLLRDLLDRRPASLRLMITTRQRCPVWLNQSRAHGEVLTVTAADLRLTSTDVRAIIGQDLPDLEGWALGVSFIATLGRPEADQAVRDYFRAEVMARTTTEMRYLLSAVSVAGDVDPDLALHLTGNPEAGKLLARFAATTQLVTTSPGPLFRLHPVLAKYLVDELVLEAWSSYLSLRHRLADWLGTHGDLAQATRVYVEAHAADQARTCVLRHWQRLVLAGHVGVVCEALDNLPAEELASDPRMCVVKAMTHLATGDHAEWRRWVGVAAVHDDAEIEPGVSVKAAIAVSERFALALTTGSAPDHACDRRLPGLWAAIDGVANGLCAVWSKRYVDAATSFGRAEIAARVSGDNLALVHALSGTALAEAFGGGTNALALADEAIATADRLPASCRWVVANAYLALAVTHLAAGADIGARDAANEVLAVLWSLPLHVEQRTRAHASAILESLERPSPTAVRAADPEATATPSHRGLSDRERRVLRALCGPLTLREIADELYVSHTTIKTQVSSIFKKLGVHDRAAAVAAARSWCVSGSNPADQEADALS